MKHIPGNTFLNKSTRYGKFLKKGLPYTLRIIKPKRDTGQLQYIFDTNLGERDIVFESAKQADDFLEQFIIN